MIEYTIIAIQKQGKVGGIGILDKPNSDAVEAAKAVYVFRRGDTRIHVLIANGDVTESEARQLAINLYENRCTRIDFNDAKRIDRNAALWSIGSTP